LKVGSRRAFVGCNESPLLSDFNFGKEKYFKKYKKKKKKETTRQALYVHSIPRKGLGLT
jgi:adenine-specific DNA glycosylase